MTTIDARLHELAERQHGLVAREQALALGLHRSGWWRRVHGEHWELLGTGVARRRGSPPTDEQQALAAVLDAGSGAALVGSSAAALWGIPGHRLRPLQVATPRRQVRSPLATLHLPRMDLAPHTVVLEGVPVVRPALLLLQLAALVHPGRLRRHLDQLWSRRLLSAASVRWELSALMHRGRPGTAALRELLDALPADYVPPASGLESRFESILERHGLPAMRRQVDVGDQHRWTGRVDYLAHDLPVVAEVDSDRYHRALSSTDDDAARDRAMADGGFVVARVTQFQVWHRPAEVVEAILTARREARDRVRAAA